MRISLVVIVCVLALAPGLAAPAHAATQVSPADAYSQVIGWGMGLSGSSQIGKHRTDIDDAQQRIERASYRYGIQEEFAMAVVSSEAYFSPQISFARAESWSIYEQATGKKLPQYPGAMTDLDTSLSTLAAAIGRSRTVDEVLSLYWSGPNHSRNADSLPQFKLYVTKLYNGLKPYYLAREQAQRTMAVRPNSFNELSGENDWGDGTASADDLSGFRSKLGNRPLHRNEIGYFGHHDDEYAAQVQKFNHRVGDEDAHLIARTILTYCKKTDFEVDPRLVMAVVAAESRFSMTAVSSCGALGLGQLMPATARSNGVSNCFDPLQNLYGCVKYIEREQHRWGSSPNHLDLIIAAYNAGPGAVQRYGGVPPYRETRNYVNTVKRYYSHFAPEVQISLR